MNRHSRKPITTLLLGVVGLSFACWAIADQSGPVIPKGKGEQCVADTAFMRRNHMDLLIHQRDETVIEGIRQKPFSLVECVDCHAGKGADGQALRVDAEGQFCQSCHAYVAVKIDCFSCHAAVPDADDDTAHLQRWIDRYSSLPTNLVAHLHGLKQTNKPRH